MWSQSRCVTGPSLLYSVQTQDVFDSKSHPIDLEFGYVPRKDSSSITERSDIHPLAYIAIDKMRDSRVLAPPERLGDCRAEDCVPNEQA